MAWLFAPISTQAVSVRAESAGQVTWTLNVALQPASPSETFSVSEAVPGALQVSVGFWAVALLSVPEVVVQAVGERLRRAVLIAGAAGHAR